MATSVWLSSLRRRGLCIPGMRMINPPSVCAITVPNPSLKVGQTLVGLSRLSRLLTSDVPGATT